MPERNLNRFLSDMILYSHMTLSLTLANSCDLQHYAGKNFSESSEEEKAKAGSLIPGSTGAMTGNLTYT